MKKKKNEQSLTKQVEKIVNEAELNQDSIEALTTYRELIQKGLVVKRPYYVDFSGFRQVMDQVVGHSDSSSAI